MRHFRGIIMIKIGICDDDDNMLYSISKIIESASISINFETDISCVTNNQDIIYNKIKSHKIDILFLDIEFNNKGKNGIDFALELRKINKQFKLVFITAHFEYAMLAYSCKTFDYLLKPVDLEKASGVLKRLKEDLTSSNSDTGFIKLNKDYMVRTKDIFFIERNKCKTTIYTKDSTYETCYSLNAIKSELPDSFLRIHRSYIVNQNEIIKINKETKTICFDNGLNCPMGQFKSFL